ncbi:hypothetical protein AB9K24_05910 [Meridianimaribacter flavus]
MEPELVHSLIQKSVNDLYKYDSYILSNHYNINERSVTHRLAIYLEKQFSDYGYHVDIEYNRMRKDYDNKDELGNLMGKKLNWEDTGEGSSYVYPDIIVHKRDTDDNLIEIEVKMAWKNYKKQFDYDKINRYMTQLGYQFGVYVELHENLGDCLIEYGKFEF